MLSDEAWASRERLLAGLVQTPGYDKLMSGPQSKYFGGPFLDYVNQIRADSISDTVKQP